MLTHERAVGDTQTPLALTITSNGTAVNLTGKNVKFTMIRNSDGFIKIPETAADITNAALGHVDYDFDAADVDTEGVYTGYARVYDDVTGEPTTFPGSDEGIEITIFAINKARPADDPTLLSDERFMELATAPKKVRTVEGMVEERSVDELLKIKAMTDPVAPVPWGMRVAKIKPPSTTSS